MPLKSDASPTTKSPERPGGDHEKGVRRSVGPRPEGCHGSGARQPLARNTARHRVRVLSTRGEPGGPTARSWRPGAPAFWSAAARAAGVPASPHRRGRVGVAGKGCDRADGTPAACLVAWTAAPGRCTAGGARLDIVRSVTEAGGASAGTMSNPARPGEGQRWTGYSSLPLPLPLPLLTSAF